MNSKERKKNTNSFLFGFFTGNSVVLTFILIIKLASLYVEPVKEDWKNIFCFNLKQY